MDPIELFGGLPRARVLDVATGGGGFIHFLLEGLPDPAEIVGVDLNERGAETFAQAFDGHPQVRFERMDARRLEFPAASFDLVSIANSLHHFDDPSAVLDEMLRVLRPGGLLVVSEMYRDGQSEIQMTHVLLHHWWAAVDRVDGVVHHETHTRAGLLDLLAPLGLRDLRLQDIAATDDDPFRPEIMAQLGPVFERYQARAAGRPDLQAQGQELRRRVEQIGFHSATTLLAVGRKG